jgi:DNA polymerase-1
LLLELRCPLTKKSRKTGKFNVDSEVLGNFKGAHPVLGKILDWRDAEKLDSTYTVSILERLDSQDVLHPDYQQAGTDTGRLSCRSPNFQNQPVDSDDRSLKYTGKKLEDGGRDPWSIRRAYINRGPGWVRVFFDYSQIELRVMAFYSKDPIMVKAYLEGEDIHARTSAEVFGSMDKAHRRPAKILNFGLSYGMSEHGFSRQAKMPLDQAAQYMDRFFTRYAGIKRFREMFWGYVRGNGSTFQNLFGRPRRLPDITALDDFTRARAERQAIATLIQGTAAQLTKESMVRVAREFKDRGLPAYPVANVHDEIQVDCHTSVLSEVSRIMQGAMEAFPEFNPIPIVVDGDYTTESWADKRPLPL